MRPSLPVPRRIRLAASAPPDARDGVRGDLGVRPWLVRPWLVRPWLSQSAARGWILAATLAGLQPVFAQGQPSAGRYDGRLCVTTSAAPRQCGQAEVVVFNGDRVAVRISDVRYELTLQGGRVDVGLLHGNVQIDGFTGDYAWKGAGRDAVLHFVDAEKKSHYEVRFTELVAGRLTHPGATR